MLLLIGQLASVYKSCSSASEEFHDVLGNMHRAIRFTTTAASTAQTQKPQASMVPNIFESNDSNMSVRSSYRTKTTHTSTPLHNTQEAFALKRRRSNGDIGNKTPRPVKKARIDDPITTIAYVPQPREHQVKSILTSPSRQRMFASPGNGVGCWSDRRVLVPKVDLDND